VILGRFFHTSVLCIHQEGHPDDIAVTFARGRTMPLFRGATPKVILANLPPVRVLKDIYLSHGEKIREAGLGGDWNSFRANLREIRKAGFYVTPGGEVDHAVTGIAAPIFDKQKEILASVTLAVSERHCTPEMVESFVEMVCATAQEITEDVARLEDSLGSETADIFAPAAAG
jgi:DNA-binding IclR family transcriptional regulator